MQQKNQQQTYDLGLQQEHYDSIEQLFNAYKTDGDVKIITSDEILFKQDVAEVYDVQIAKKGPIEDKIYAKRKYLRSNVRRGNTVIKIKNQQQQFQYLIGRKGLQKFFDVRIEDIMNHIEFGKQIYQDNKSEQDTLIKECIFDEVEQILSNNTQRQEYAIQVIKSVKANGENCQITFIKQLQAWMICSKNVSLLARSKEDLLLYNDSEKFQQRYHFAQIIAEEWFNQLGKVNQICASREQNDFDQFLSMCDKYTLVGEYCGNQAFQHLIKYNRIELFFYALVEKVGVRTCEDIQLTYHFFEQFGLSAVQTSVLGTFTTFKELNLGLKHAFEEVSSATIDSFQEGCVLYFVKVPIDSQSAQSKGEVVTLCKLKTLEYRIYRKLREKLKVYISVGQKKGTKKFQPQKDWNNLFSKFINETKSLCSVFKPPRPLQYYFAVALKAFNFVTKFPNDTKIVHEAYVSFICVVLECLDQDKDVTPKMFDENNIHRVMAKPWADYSHEHVLAIHQEEEKFQNEQQFQKNKNQIDEDFKNELTQQQIPQIKGHFKIVAMIPIGIPGLGKTYFRDQIQKVVISQGDAFLSVSSDQIRKELIEKIMQENKDKTFENAFNQSTNSSKTKFDKELSSLFKTSQSYIDKNVFIFLDKNHPPNGVQNAIKFIKNCFESIQDYHFQLKIISLLPISCSQFVTQNPKNTYPFSLNIFLTCLKRLLLRQDHETIIFGEINKNVAIGCFFYNFFKNQDLGQNSHIFSGLDNIFQLPFVLEEQNNQSKYENKLINLVEQALLANSKKPDAENPATKELADYIYNNADNKQEVEEAAVQESIQNMINQLQLPKKDHVVQITQIYKAHIIDNNQEEEQKNDQNFQTEVRQKNILKKDKQNLQYLGIFDSNNDKSIVEQFIIQGLQLAAKCQASQEQSDEIQKQIDSFNKKKYVQPKDGIHLTTFNLQGKTKQNRSDQCQKFKEGLKVELKIVAFLYVPDCIITGICFLDDQTIEIEDQFPHVTLAISSINNWKENMSKKLMKSLFQKGELWNNIYSQNDLTQPGEYVNQTTFHFKIQTGGSKDKKDCNCKVFLIKPNMPLILNGITKKC